MQLNVDPADVPDKSKHKNIKLQSNSKLKVKSNNLCSNLLNLHFTARF